MKRILLILFVILIITLPATANKTLRINDDFNIKYLNEIKYDVYINGSFSGHYEKDDVIYFDDSSDIIIFIPAPIKTDFSNTWELTKSMLINLIGFIMAFMFIIIIIIIFYRKIFRRK